MTSYINIIIQPSDLKSTVAVIKLMQVTKLPSKFSLFPQGTC